MVRSGLLVRGGVTEHQKKTHRRVILFPSSIPEYTRLCFSRQQRRKCAQNKQGLGERERSSFSLGPGLHPSFIREPWALGRSRKTKHTLYLLPLPLVPVSLGDLWAREGSGWQSSRPQNPCLYSNSSVQREGRARGGGDEGMKERVES